MRGVSANAGLLNAWSVVRGRSLMRLLLQLCHSSATRTPPAAGEGRSVLDPANADFVESIRSGTCPRELDPLDPSKHVSPHAVLLTFSVSCCSPQIADPKQWKVPPKWPRMQDELLV